MTPFVRAVCLLGACALVAGAAGCSGSKASATGKVMYDGRQVKSGTVIFYGADGVGVPAVLDSEGVYRVEGLPTGTVKVAVSSPSPAETATALNATGRGPAGPLGKNPKDPKDQPKDPNWFLIPPKYGAPGTSGITLPLKAGPNEADIVFK